MEAQTILYETLSPLRLSPASSPPPSKPLNESPEPYFVYRNEISLSSLHCSSSETAAPDYFSLDVGCGFKTLNFKRDDGASLNSQPTTSAGKTLESGWFKGNCRFKSPMLQLHKEIVDFCDFLSPTPEEQEARDAAVRCVFSVIRYIWPNCTVEVFGSFKTGLYLPTSDIDVVILGSDVRTAQIGLQALSKALSQKGVAKRIQVIAKARVPIIKFVEKKSSIAFDVSFDVQNGPMAAEFIKDAICRWPSLRPLCLILKVFLQQRELNEVYSGGIGSYALLAMLIAMLKHHHHYHYSPEQNLGMLLVNFFDIYGRKLNISDVGVSCNSGGTFFLKSSRGFLNKGRPFLISIEDPQAPENDIGKNSFNFFQIRSAFSMAFSTLTNSKTLMSLAPNRSILGTIIRPDPVLLERKGGRGGHLTFKSLFPGESSEPHYGDEEAEVLCNWDFNVAEDQPLPCESWACGDGSPEPSGKKRKGGGKRMLERTGKKVKGNGHVGPEEKNSSRERGNKKRRWRHYSRDEQPPSRNYFDRCSWSHTC